MINIEDVINTIWYSKRINFYVLLLVIIIDRSVEEIIRDHNGDDEAFKPVDIDAHLINVINDGKVKYII